MRLLNLSIFPLLLISLGQNVSAQNINTGYSLDFTDPNLPISPFQTFVGPNNDYSVLGTMNDCTLKPGATFPSTQNPLIFCPGLQGERGASNFQILAFNVFSPPISTFTVKLGIADVVKNGQVVPLATATQQGGQYPALRLTFQSLGNQTAVVCTVSGPVKSSTLFPSTFQSTLDVEIDSVASGSHPTFTFVCTSPPINASVAPKAGKFNPVVFFQSVNFTAGSISAPTISVAEAHFEQVIEDPQLPPSQNGVFDAVAGKSASFKILLTGSNLEAANPQDTVIVTVTDSSGKNSHSPPIAVSDIQSANIYTVYPHQMSDYVPSTPGFSPITVHIDTTSAKDVTSSDYKSISLNVHQVIAPTIGFSRINAINQCRNQSAPCTTEPAIENITPLLMTDAFVSAAFPVPDLQYRYSSIQPASIPTILGSDIDSQSLQDFEFDPNAKESLQRQQFEHRGLKALVADILNLNLRRTQAGTGRMIGIVSDSYFLSHGFPAGMRGVTSKSLRKDPLAIENVPEAVPHELGHSFKQFDEYYVCNDPKNCTKALYTDVPVFGYDATTKRSYIWPFPQSRDPSALPAWSTMGPTGRLGGLWGNSSPQSNAYNYWMDNQTYLTSLATILTDVGVDPQTILVGGFISKKGIFEFENASILPNGEVTASEANGDLAVSALDSNGNVLSTVTLRSDFTATATFESEASALQDFTIQLSSMPFSVQLPYSSEVTAVQVASKGVVVAKSALRSQLLIGILSRIPAAAYREPLECKFLSSRQKLLKGICQNFPDLYRNSLKKQAEVIQKILDSKKPENAIILLKALIVEIKLITLPSYPLADASELSQADVVAQIQAIINSLQKKDPKHDATK